MSFQSTHFNANHSNHGVTPNYTNDAKDAKAPCTTTNQDFKQHDTHYGHSQFQGSYNHHQHLSFLVRLLSVMELTVNDIPTSFGILNADTYQMYENFILDRIKVWNPQSSAIVDDLNEGDNLYDQDYNGSDEFGCELRSDSEDPNLSDRDFIDDT